MTRRLATVLFTDIVGSTQRSAELGDLAWKQTLEDHHRILRAALERRGGVHTGEVETIDAEIGGLCVTIGARIGALAGSSEVLASSTVKDLSAGSGQRFEDAGEHELKGVPDRWRLYRVVG